MKSKSTLDEKRDSLIWKKILRKQGQDYAFTAEALKKLFDDTMTPLV